MTCLNMAEREREKKNERRVRKIAREKTERERQGGGRIPDAYDETLALTGLLCNEQGLET